MASSFNITVIDNVTGQAKSINYYEAGIVNFNNSNQTVITFTKPFKTVPTVVVQENTAIAFSRVVTTVSKTGFVIRLGAVFTGQITWRATEN